MDYGCWFYERNFSYRASRSSVQTEYWRGWFKPFLITDDKVNKNASLIFNLMYHLELCIK